jgi:formylglycine-generating enzyme required for sulfatase activity
MSALILFVAAFMVQQSEQLATDQLDSGLPGSAELAGFRSDMWYLPDEPLLGFVEISAGPFIMGSNPALDRMAYQNERWSNLQRQGEVDLPTYYIARFETTQAQFNAYVRDTGVAQAAVDVSVPGDYPVTNVTWPDALAYARWLETRLRNSPDTPPALMALFESGARITLPNEAEWEKAARGTDGRIFPWGARPRSNLANFGSDGPMPVGAIDCEPCAHGLADMAGNVWELTRSPLQDYPFDPSDDQQVQQGDPLYVMRGGSWADELNNVRTAVRGAVDPGVRNNTIGFRLAISTQ